MPAGSRARTTSARCNSSRPEAEPEPRQPVAELGDSQGRAFIGVSYRGGPVRRRAGSGIGLGEELVELLLDGGNGIDGAGEARQRLVDASELNEGVGER